MKVFKMMIWFFCVLLTLSFTSSAKTSTRNEKMLSKKIERIFVEAQHRRGPTLDARLTEMWQAVLPLDPEIEKYLKENPRRRGALIYVRASGESGEKTIRIFFYSSSEMEGKLAKNIGEWALPNPIAQAVAKNIAKILSAEPEASFLATAETSESKAELILAPRSGRALKNPLLGESLTQR
jgi:hypothetical protein